MKKKFSTYVFGSVTLVAPLILSGVVACSDDDDEGGVCEDTTMVSEDEDADFENYSTFAVADLSDLAAMGGAGGGSGAEIPEDVQADLDSANEAAAAQLAAKGLEEVDPAKETPDLWVFSIAATEDQSGTYWACVPGYTWWGYYWYWDPCSWLAPIPVEYTEGTLVVGVADSAEEKVVFGGAVQGILECSDENQIDQRITDAVNDIFAQYPAD